MVARSTSVTYKYRKWDCAVKAASTTNIHIQVGRLQQLLCSNIQQHRSGCGRPYTVKPAGTSQDSQGRIFGEIVCVIMNDGDNNMDALAWIDREFIEKALRNGYEDPDICVESLTVKPALALGENYGSAMYKVAAQLKGNGCQKRSLIVKTLPHGPRSDLIDKFGVFPRETHMFTDTLPALHRILREYEGEKFQPLSAKCLLHGEIPTKYIILEDLCESGFKNASRHKGLDLKHCLLVMKSLSRFHAASIVLQERSPRKLEFYEKSLFNMDMTAMFEQFTDALYGSMLNTMEKYPDLHAKYAEKLRDFSKHVLNKFAENVNYKEGHFNVLLHGDLWVNNLMFRYNGDEPVELRFVDFQLSTHTSPGFDLQYFLQTSTNKTVIMHHTYQLITEYHRCLMNLLEDLGHGKSEYTLEDFLKDYHECAFYGLHALVAVFPLIVASSEMAQGIHDNIENMIKGENIMDSSSLYSQESFMERLRNCLPYFEETGCFTS